MQGKSEFVVTGSLKDWEQWDRLHEIKVRPLTIGAQYDEMDLEDMKKMATLMPNAASVICPDGSHMCFWDDQEVYFRHLIGFLRTVNLPACLLALPDIAGHVNPCAFRFSLRELRMFNSFPYLDDSTHCEIMDIGIENAYMRERAKAIWNKMESRTHSIGESRAPTQKRVCDADLRPDVQRLGKGAPAVPLRDRLLVDWLADGRGRIDPGGFSAGVSFSFESSRCGTCKRMACWHLKTLS
jgi:hypothetical protein